MDNSIMKLLFKFRSELAILLFKINNSAEQSETTALADPKERA